MSSVLFCSNSTTKFLPIF